MSVVIPLDEHPIPFDQDAINEFWREDSHRDESDAPHVDEAHEQYADTVAEYGDWHVFRVLPPFLHHGIVFWNRASGDAFVVDESEGNWHELVNLFAEIVDAEGDCRDADFTSSLMVSGSHSQKCDNCGQGWSI